MKKQAGRQSKTLEEKIEDAFVVGSRHACGKKIWDWIRRNKLKDMRDSALAAELNVYPSTISRWKTRGMLELESLLVLMAEYTFDFDSLDRPANEHLAIGGYVEGTTLTLSSMLQEPLDQMTVEEFCCLWSLHRRHADWQASWHAGDGQRLFELVAELVKYADALLVSYLNDVPEPAYNKKTNSFSSVSIRTPEAFQLLHKRWGKAWKRCLNAVRHDWMEVA